MRDPCAPIPRATHRALDGPTGWMRARPPPPSLDPHEGDRDPRIDDPTRWLAEVDPLGIDRRRTRRTDDFIDLTDAAELEAIAEPNTDSITERRDDAIAGDVVAAAHVAVRRTIGLVAPHGRGIVEAISLCPNGVLVRAIDPRAGPMLAPSMSGALRSLIGSLCEHGPSPLAAAGVAVLSAEIVRDLAAWAWPRSDASPPSPRVPLPSVQLVVARAADPPLRVTGRLAAMTDPQPDVLAIALPRASLDALAIALLDPR